MNLADIFRQNLKEAASVLDSLSHDKTCEVAVVRAAEIMAHSLQNKGRIVSCGNGGSHCDAMHFAEELSGRFRENRPAYAAMAISDPAHISCTANDYGFDFIFSRFVEAHLRQGDVLLAISTSGTSRNVIEAAKAAKKQQALVVSLTGKPHSALAELANVDICTPGLQYADRVQELHIKVIHSLIQMIEKQMGV